MNAFRLDKRLGVAVLALWLAALASNAIPITDDNGYINWAFGAAAHTLTLVLQTSVGSVKLEVSPD